MQNLTIEVCSRDEAGAILTSEEQRTDVCFLISLGDPGASPPAGYEHASDKLRLLFSDTADPDGATDSVIQQIIDVAHTLPNRSGRVIVHCHAGVSRSSAAAVILNAVLLGPGKELEAASRVIAQRPIAQPNRRMIAIADRLLGRGGRLLQGVATVNKDR